MSPFGKLTPPPPPATLEEALARIQILESERDTFYDRLQEMIPSQCRHGRHYASPCIACDDVDRPTGALNHLILYLKLIRNGHQATAEEAIALLGVVTQYLDGDHPVDIPEVLEEMRGFKELVRALGKDAVNPSV